MTENSFDLLVVGSGAAGLSAALRAADLGASVAVLTAGPLLAGSSPRAQGGVAAAFAADDTPALHAADTVRVGAGLNDASAVDILTRYGSESVRSLRASGVAFADDLGLEAGHSYRRIHHAGGGATGQVVTTALLARAQRSPRIALFDFSPVTALIVRPGNHPLPPSPLSFEGEGGESELPTGTRVTGVRVGQKTFPSRATVLATGGYAALWARTTNAPETRGSGLELAYAAGASLADLEFVQFHPTALSLDGAPALLLSEALRGEGARLVDDADHDLVNPLLPRDVLARALHAQLSSGTRVFLSLRHLDPDHVYAHFAALADTLKQTAQLDLARDRIPVAPAAHYCMGGIRTDIWGRTDVAGLYAAGEVACSGAQGANRLASNSLLECLVFGARTAEAALSDSPSAAAHARWHTTPISTDLIAPTSLRDDPDPSTTGSRLDRDVGVERDVRGLSNVISAAPESLPTLIARAALLRDESRGAHFRTDAPQEDPRWRGRIHWRRASAPVFEEVAA